MSNTTTQVPDRDHSRTGASSGINATFINFDGKVAKWKINGELHDSISFYLDRVDMEWRDAVAGTDIPAHWEIRIVGECNLGEGVKQYNFSLSSHWRTPLLGNIANALLGAMNTEAWKSNPRNRLVRMYTYLRQNTTNARSQSRAMLFNSEAKDDFMPDMYPWDDSAKRFQGVPDDLEKANDFWLERCRDLVMATGGTVSGLHPWTEAFKVGKGIATSHVNGTPTTPPQATESATAPPAHSLALAYAQKKVMTEGMPFSDGVKTTVTAFVQRGHPEGSARALIAALTEWGTKVGSLPAGSTITMTGDIVAAAPPVNTTITANHDPIDDLPF